MTKMNAEKPEAKALTLDERSNAIIVSFDSKWHQPFLNSEFSVVIRKRVPRDRTFEWIYAHIKSPVGAICGRARIKRIGTMAPDQAANLFKSINLSKNEIIQYISGDGAIGFYEIGQFYVAAKPARTDEINKYINYNPPQSFTILSTVAKKTIDALCGFENSFPLKALTLEV